MPRQNFRFGELGKELLVLIIRKFKVGDELALREIFFNTIRKVNIKNYSYPQVQAWAPAHYDEQAWEKRISALNPFIATLDGTIVGYADLQEDGYIDHFYCHWQYLGQGVGKRLMQKIFESAESKKLMRLYAHVSITAKPFFEHFGFKVVTEQSVEVRGQVLTNYLMERLTCSNQKESRGISN